MPQPEHDPYEDLYNDVPSLTEATAPGATAPAPGNGQPDQPAADAKTDQPAADGKSDQPDAGRKTDPSTGDGPAIEAPKNGPAQQAKAQTPTDKAAAQKKPASKEEIEAYNPYDDPIYDPDYSDTEGEAQDNFVESKEPSELLMCLILASAYLGLAKYCWTPLLLAKDWKLLFNIEGFFLCIAILAILIGFRPYLSPSALQISRHGIKYRGPYWPQRKTINWSQVGKLYLSPELVVVLYHPKAGSKRLWPLLIPIVYLSDRERIAKVFIKYSPFPPVILSSPALISRIVVLLAILAIIIWVLELLIQ